MILLAMAVALACIDPGADVETYVAALSDGSCGRVRDADLRDDCWVAQAERHGVNRCAEVTGTVNRDECWFQLAEHDDDATWCANAGAFADDCRMHHVSRRFRALGRKDTPSESDVSAVVTGAGLAVDDPRPWTAWYRERLSRQARLDRSVCPPPPGVRADACRNAGFVLYNDRLNRARDTRSWRCGTDLPLALQVIADPELDALRARRSDACTP